MKKMIHTISALIIIGGLLFIASKFLMISTKDTIVNTRRYLGNSSNPAEIYGYPPDGLYYSPMNINITPMDKLMLVDIEDDPYYKSIELQTFDDSRGQGARVLLYPHKGPADVYYTNSDFEIRLSENADYTTDPDIEYHFEVTGSGLDAFLKMKDNKGRPVGFSVQETLRKEWSRGFLAPIGGNDAVTFTYFPFFHMKNMNFVLRSGTEISVYIDGVQRKPKRLPIPVDWEFVYLSRYTDEPVMVSWNKAFSGELHPVKASGMPAEKGAVSCFELVNNNGHHEIRKMTESDKKHKVFFDFSPPVPDLVCLKNDVDLNGRFCAGVDNIGGILAGTYNIKRQEGLILMEIRPAKGWQPIPGRKWVKTWIWKGAISVQPDSTVTMKSFWVRE
jgi:hypothetical protein